MYLCLCVLCICVVRVSVLCVLRVLCARVHLYMEDHEETQCHIYHNVLLQSWSATIQCTTLGNYSSIIINSHTLQQQEIV